MNFPVVIVYNERGSVYDQQHKTERGMRGYQSRHPNARPVEAFCPRCGERCWRLERCPAQVRT